MWQFCKSCALRDYKTNVCMRTGDKVTEDDYCSKHIREIPVCEICGNKILITANSMLIQDSKENWHTCCSSCSELFKTCQTCVAPCEFETNPDPMPKVVMKTVRQGNMQIQAQVMNPDRVNKFCPDCGCYDKEFGCKRQFNVACEQKVDVWEK